MDPDALVAEGAANLAQGERLAWVVVLVSVLVGGVSSASLYGAAVIPWLPGEVAAAVSGLSVVGTVFFTLAGFRTHLARRSLKQGCREVLAVGWMKPPDGCNYAVFQRDANPAESDPDLVLRLPVRRRTVKSLAFLCGSTRPSRFRSAAALLSPDGTVLGVGRVRPTANGQEVWRRRHAPAPWWWTGPDVRSRPDV
jgi:hypothetical protein